MVLCIRASKGLVRIQIDSQIVLSVGAGCAGIVAVCNGVRMLSLPLLLSIFAAVGGSVLVYAAVLLALKNPFAWEMWKTVKEKLFAKV